jgi:hypothetical protein
MTMKNAVYAIAVSLVASTAFLSVPASAGSYVTQTRNMEWYASARGFNGPRHDGVGISSRSYNRGYSDAMNGLGYHPRGDWSVRYYGSYGNPSGYAIDIHSDPANM